MPKIKNWSKEGDGEWQFDDIIIIEGKRVRPKVHVYQSGSGEDREYFAELYFPDNLEEYSESIDSNGKVTHYASPKSSMAEAKENARKFMKKVQFAGGIRHSANAPVLPEGFTPSGWSYIEGDKEYLLFAHSNNMSNSRVQLSRQDTGTWDVAAMTEEMEKVNVATGLHFGRALEEAKDYMSEN